MKEKLLLSGLIICAIGLLGGCAVHIVPTIQSVNPANISQIDINYPVSIKNVQNSREVIPITSAGRITGNLHEFTEHAVLLLEQELKNRNVKVVNGADKILQLSITEIQLTMGAWRRTCALTLSVKTGDMMSKEYKVTNASGGNAHRACGGAITLSLTKLLNDKTIINYLANSES